MKGKFDLKKALVVSLVALGFIVLTIHCVEVTKSRDALRVTLTSAQDALATAQVELVSVHSELASTETELTSVRGYLASVEVELASTQGILTTTESVLASARTELVTARADLVSVQQALLESRVEMSAVQQQLLDVTEERDVALETLYGLGITLSESERNYDADLVDSAMAVNPSWGELMGFLASDHTEDHEYVADTYDCSEFSRDVHNNAEALGIRAAVVHDRLLLDWVGHALNAFLTTDYGLVYVDCTGSPDTIAYVVCGETFKAVEVGAISPSNVRNGAWWDALVPGEYYYLLTWYGGAAITESITIFW